MSEPATSAAHHAPLAADERMGEAYEHAFAVMPVPALLVNNVRVVAANEAAQRLLPAVSGSLAVLRDLLVTSARLGARNATIEAGAERYRITSTNVSATSSLRLCLLVSALPSEPPKLYDRWGLSLPESRVADKLVRGLKNREIASDLGLAIETVRKHVAHIFRKSGARTRAEFVALALRP